MAQESGVGQTPGSPSNGWYGYWGQVIRTTEPLRPARSVQRPVALGLGAVLLDELRHRQSRLELHVIHGHGVSPPRNIAPRLRRRRLISRDGRLSVVANQEVI